MKRLFFSWLFLISVLILSSCDRQLISSGLPNVITHSAVDQGDVIRFSGELKNADGTVIDEVGFIWQNNDDPFFKPGFMVISKMTGSDFFTAEVSWSMTDAHKYVLRAYAKCGDKIIYGETLAFKSALTLPCQLLRIEPDSAFRGDTIRLVGKGFNRTIQYNKVLIGGKNSVIVGVNDSVLTCVVPLELPKGPNSVNIEVNGINGDFGTRFKLLLPPPPQVITMDAGNVSWFTASIGGSVDPNNLPCSVSFEYGPTSSYGKGILAVPVSFSGDSAIYVTAGLTNLSQNTVYHYRIKAISEAGTSYGEDHSFRTLEAPPIPMISSLSANTIKYGNTLTIHGHNMKAITGVLLGSQSQSIPVIPKNISPESIEIEVYNHANPTQLLGFSSFRIGLVTADTTVWSGYVTIKSGWTRLNDLPANARYKSGSFSLNGKIYIGGGAGDGLVFKDFWKFETETGVWSRMADIPGIPRVYPSGSSNNSHGFMGSGFSADNSSKYQLYDFYKYDPQTNTWSTIPDYPDIINNFFFNYSISINGRPHICLSNTVPYVREIVNDSWVSHPSVTDLMDSPANGVIVIGNSYFVLTGFRTSGAINKSVWEYNTIAETWTKRADFPGSPRHSPVFFSIGKYGYYGCGRSFDTEQYKDMWRYDSVEDSWIRIEDFPGGFRSHTISASDGRFGYTGMGVLMYPVTYFKDFWKYDAE